MRNFIDIKFSTQLHKLLRRQTLKNSTYYTYLHFLPKVRYLNVRYFDKSPILINKLIINTFTIILHIRQYINLRICTIQLLYCADSCTV